MPLEEQDRSSKWDVAQIAEGVALNHAGQSEAALASLAEISEIPKVSGFQLYHVAMEELLFRLRRLGEAQGALQNAVGHTENAAQKSSLERKASAWKAKLN